MRERELAWEERCTSGQKGLGLGLVSEGRGSRSEEEVRREEKENKKEMDTKERKKEKRWTGPRRA